MKALALLAVLATHSLTDQPESPRELEAAKAVTYVLKRGFFETREGKVVESHRNEIERATYGPNGRLASLVEIGVFDTLYRFEEYYDAMNRVTESTVLRGGSLHAAESRAYDDLGRLVDWKIFDDGKDLSMRKRHVYKGKLLVAKDVYARTVRADDIVHLERHVYTYDKAGKVNQETVYRMFPKKQVAKVSVFDPKGRRITLAEYDEWGEIDAEYVFEYQDGPDGLWTRQTQLKKVGKGEDQKLVPVDVLYRDFAK